MTGSEILYANAFLLRDIKGVFLLLTFNFQPNYSREGHPISTIIDVYSCFILSPDCFLTKKNTEMNL